MSSWDGRCKRCRRLMSICKCFVTGSGDQTSNSNGFSSGRTGDDTSPMQLAHGKRHLFETLKEQHPLRARGLVSIHGEADADKRAHHLHRHHYHSTRTQQQRGSSALRTSTAYRTTGRSPSSSGITSSSVPATSSHISRPSTTTAHRHSSPVPPRDSSTAIPTLPTSRSDPAAIRQYQTTQGSSRMSSSRYAPLSPSEDPSSQYYVDYSVPPEESDPAIYEL